MRSVYALIFLGGMQMKKINEITLILRGFSKEEALLIANEASKYNCFNLEITTNTPDWENIIKSLIEASFNNVPIGAGTVLNTELLNRAITAGAKFALSPIMMTKEMLEICNKQGIISVPSGFSPSEIWTMHANGADIIKVFPASRLSPKYISDVLAPLGQIPLMVVGGINSDNLLEYMKAGAVYSGIGSGFCSHQSLMSGDVAELQESLKELSRINNSYHAKTKI